MNGLTLEGLETVVFQTDLPEPTLADPGDVIVRVLRAGICGSDLHQYHGREPVGPGTILGHEFVGDIVAIGSSVTQLRVGDRVFSPFTTCCGHCFFCRHGLSARCDHWQFFGYRPPPGVDDGGRGLPGAQAQLIRVPLADTTLVRLPTTIGMEEAILLGDNFSTGFFCADQGAVSPTGLTAVLGCGAVGLSAIVAARYLGAQQIVAVDAVAARRQRAQQLGAMATTPEEAVELVHSLAGHSGRGGADSVLEAVGLPAAQQLAFQLVRPGGVISAVGMHTSATFAFSPADAYNRNLTYRAGRCPVRSYLDRLVPAVESGNLSIPVEQIITHARIPLHAGADAYRRFSDRTDDCVKILLDPHA